MPSSSMTSVSPEVIFMKYHWAAVADARNKKLTPNMKLCETCPITARTSIISTFCGTRRVAMTDARVSSGKYMLLREDADGQNTPTHVSNTRKLTSCKVCSWTTHGIASAMEPTAQANSISFSTVPPNARYCLYSVPPRMIQSMNEEKTHPWDTGVVDVSSRVGVHITTNMYIPASNSACDKPSSMITGSPFIDSYEFSRVCSTEISLSP
mmetsp:Transcript_45783/g.73642  ORF Transcript_45783/g.73642 Transcript_45783/m.73642 type:complete len:210 (+) Transcript_45783:566-1195(+)